LSHSPTPEFFLNQGTSDDSAQDQIRSISYLGGSKDIRHSMNRSADLNQQIGAFHVGELGSHLTGEQT